MSLFISTYQKNSKFVKKYFGMVASKLNPIQESLLRLFSRPMTEEETLQLKRVLVKHYNSLLKTELEKVMQEKAYTDEDFEKMLNDPS